MSDLIIEGAKGIPDGLYVIKDGLLFKYKPNGGTVYTARAYHVTDRPVEWTTDEVAELLANTFGDECACNWNGIDEWLPEVCPWCKSEMTDVVMGKEDATKMMPSLGIVFDAMDSNTKGET